jgi:hypothetical protein
MHKIIANYVFLFSARNQIEINVHSFHEASFVVHFKKTNVKGQYTHGTQSNLI